MSSSPCLGCGYVPCRCFEGKAPDMTTDGEMTAEELRTLQTKARLYDDMKRRHRGAPCACLIDDDGETILTKCAAHEAAEQAAAAREREACAAIADAHWTNSGQMVAMYIRQRGGEAG